MKVNPTLELGVGGGQPEPKWTMLQRIYQRLATAVNGNISFGNGTDSDNVAGVWINVQTPGTPNTDFTVTHNLGYTPAGWDLVQKDAACDVYLSPTPNTTPTTTLILRATAASVNVRLFVK